MRIAKQSSRIETTKAERDALWISQNGLCTLCGGAMDKDSAHLDHVIPRWLGGSNKIENRAWLHAECNMLKGGLLAPALLALCVRILRHHGYTVRAPK